MRAVRIREVSRHEHEIGPGLHEEVAHDGHVPLADRTLPHLAGLVKRQVQEPRRITGQPDGLKRRDRFGLANGPLEVLDERGVYLSRRLPRQARLHVPVHRGGPRFIQAQAPRAALDEIEVTPHVVIEHGNVAARHVGDRDGVPVLGELPQDPAHRDHVVVRMGEKTSTRRCFGRRARPRIFSRRRLKTSPFTAPGEPCWASSALR